jgi:mono/diheme cytochrome c family protein
MRRTGTILTLMAAAVAACLGADVQAGKAAYDKSCKSCHGADGTPNPNIAKMMKVDMKDLKSPDVQGEDIKAVIVNGKGKMSKSSAVTGSSADDVVAYVKTLK